MNSPLKGVIVGAGYFSRFQYEAWNRIPEVIILANCNRSLEKAESFAQEFGIPKSYASAQFREMLETEKPDFVDIITPPETHLEFCKIAAELGVTIICQKPLAPTWDETLELVELIESSDVRCMVHENWRWQPWYREIKKLIDADTIGEVFHCNVHTRLGDGWGNDAYLARQPFFRDYQRLFIFETGVHFLDTFRFLFGEVASIYAHTARRNPVIKGEDSALLLCHCESGVTAVLDANRYNECEAENPRYTFGTVRIEGSKGHLELALDGSIRIKKLGESSYLHDYLPSKNGFAGDCVFNTQRHFADQMLSGEEFESTVTDYLKSVKLVEMAYESAAKK
ncbi:Gfo/Idh/MocA family oxidoreductase [Verrucomicrobiaceae bacterium 227]